MLEEKESLKGESEPLIFELIFENEDHTIGKILSDFLKDDNKILASRSK